MRKVLVEAAVLAFVVVDLETGCVDEVVVPADVAANVMLGEILVWADSDLDEGSLDSDVEAQARRGVEATLSDSTPWRLVRQ